MDLRIGVDILTVLSSLEPIASATVGPPITAMGGFSVVL
jgi:hypothetical protein